MVRPITPRPVLLVAFPLAAVLISTIGGCSKHEPTAAPTATIGVVSTGSTDSTDSTGSTDSTTAGPATTAGTTRRTPGSSKPPRPPLTVPTLSGSFCEDLALLASMRNADDSSGRSTDTGPEDFAVLHAFFDELRASAPAEMQAPFGTIISTLTELNSLPSEGEAAITRAFELLFDPVFLQASKDINTYGRDTCGLPEDALDSFDGDAGNSGSGNGSSGGFGDNNGNDSGTNEKSIMDRVEEAYPGAPWVDAKNGHSYFSSSDSADVTVTGDFDGGLGRTACDDILKFLRNLFADVEVKVTNNDGSVTYAKAGKATGGVCVVG